VAILMPRFVEHVLCLPCWEMRNPRRVPARLRNAPLETCCACGESTRSGIYLRGELGDFPCGGHGDEAADGGER
jgi:hypothetical protein